MEEIEKFKEEIKDFFDSDISFIRQNEDILDEILANIYNLHR